MPSAKWVAIVAIVAFVTIVATNKLAKKSDAVNKLVNA